MIRSAFHPADPTGIAATCSPVDATTSPTVSSLWWFFRTKAGYLRRKGHLVALN
jgi:hypothetical protein